MKSNSVARKEAGLSQEDLAARLNVTRQTISNWEGRLPYTEISLFWPVTLPIWGISLMACYTSGDLRGHPPAGDKKPGLTPSALFFS